MELFKSQDNKRREEKRPTKKKKSERINKIAIGTYISRISLNVNGLTAPTKRHILAEWIKKIRLTYILSSVDPLQI